MTIIDALIIYLTLGAPVAMYRLLGEHGHPAISIFVRMALTLMFWPLFLWKLFSGDIGRGFNNQAGVKGSNSNIDIRAMEKNIAKAISTAVDQNISFDKRDGVKKAAEQYAGLMISDTHTSIAPAFRDLFEMSDHPNAKLAAVCLSRKNKLRLSRHLSAARSNFLIELKAATDDAVDDLYVIKKAALISVFLGDKELARSIRSLRNETAHSVRIIMGQPNRQ